MSTVPRTLAVIAIMLTFGLSACSSDEPTTSPTPSTTTDRDPPTSASPSPEASESPNLDRVAVRRNLRYYLSALSTAAASYPEPKTSLAIKRAIETADSNDGGFFVDAISMTVGPNRAIVVMCAASGDYAEQARFTWRKSLNRPSTQRQRIQNCEPSNMWKLD